MSDAALDLPPGAEPVDFPPGAEPVDLPPGAEPLPQGAGPPVAVPDAEPVDDYDPTLPPGQDTPPPGAVPVLQHEWGSGRRFMDGPWRPGMYRREDGSIWKPGEPHKPTKYVQPPPTPEEAEKQVNAHLSAIFDAMKGESPDQWASIRAIQQRTGLDPKIIKAKLPEFQAAMKAAGRDPAKFRRERPDLAQWVQEDPGRAPFVEADESLTKWAGRLWDSFTAENDPLSPAELQAVETIQESVGGRFKATEMIMEGRRQRTRTATERQKETRELNPLAATEGLDRVKIYADKWGRARRQSEVSRLGMRQLRLEMQARYASPEDATRLREEADNNRLEMMRAKAEIGVPQEYGQGPFEQLGLDVVEGLSSQADTVQALGAGAAAGYAAGAVGGGVAGLALAGPPGVLPGAAFGGKALAGPVAMALSVAQSVQLEGGGAFAELIDATDDKGNPIDVTWAAVMSLVYGAAATRIDLMTFGPEMRAFGPLGEAISAGKGITWLKNAIKDRKTAGLIRSMAKDWASLVQAEVPQEMGQAAMQFLAEWTARSGSAGEAQEIDAGEEAGKILQSGYVAALGAGAAGPIRGAGGYLVGAGAALLSSRKSEAAVNAAEEMVGNPMGGTPKDRSRLIALGAGQHGPEVTRYYFDPVELLDAIDAGDARKESVAAGLLGPDGTARLMKALEDRDDSPGGNTTLAVETETILDTWSPELFAALKAHMATAPGILTPAQRPALEKQIQDEADAIAQRAQAPVFTDEIRAHHKALDEKGRAAAYFTDRNTGLYNARGYERAPKDPARPMTARFAFPYKKPTNDKEGHQAVDGALRVMAKVIGQQKDAEGKPLLPDGVKRGGSIEVDVKDLSQAKDLAAQMAAALDPEGRIAVPVAAVARKANHDDTLKALGDALDTEEKRLIGEGVIPAERTDLPPAFKDAGILDAVKGVFVGTGEEKFKALAGTLRKASIGDAPVISAVTQDHITTTAQMDQEQLFYETYRQGAGLYNELGFHRSQELGKPEVVASLDVRGMKKVLNDAFGYENTNSILEQIAEVFVRAGGGKYGVAHLHGDEYGAVGASKAELEAFLTEVEHRLKTRLWSGKNEDTGQFVLMMGIDVAHGVNTNFDQADRVDLAKRKAEQTDLSIPDVFRTRGEMDKAIAALEAGAKAGDGRVLVHERLDERTRERHQRRAREAAERDRRSQKDPAERAAQRIGAQVAAGLDVPLFPSPEAAGLQDDPKAWKAYRERMEPTVERAQQAVRARIAKDRMRQKERFKTEEFKRYKEAAADEYRQRPDVRAEAVIFRGEVLLDDGTTITDPALRLNPEMTKAVLTEMRGGALSFAARNDAIEKLEKRLKRRLGKDGGHDPDGIAHGHGFESAAKMFEEIIRKPDEKDFVQRRAEEMLVAAYPELEADLAELKHEAELAMHSAGTKEGALEELALLRRKLPGMRFTPIESLKLGARLAVEQTKLSDLNAGLVRKREQSAANKAAVEFLRDNYEGAMFAKQTQIQRAEEWTATVEAIEEMERFENLAKALADDKAMGRLGKAGAAYRDVVENILESFGFIEPGFRDGPREGLGALAKAMEDNGDMPVDTDFLERIIQSTRDYSGQGRGKRWKDLTVGEMWSLHDALKQIRKSANNRNTAIVDGRRIDLDTIVDDQIKWTKAHGNLRDRGALASSVSAQKLIDSGLAVGESFDAYLLKARTMLGWLGDDLNSPLMRAVQTPLQKAKGNESDLGKEIYKPITEAFDAIPETVKARLFENVDGKALFPTHTQEIEAPTKRFEVLMMLPNIGNESSTQRLTEGRGITLIEIIEAANAIGITKEELAWVQTLHDVADQKVWPKVVELEERDQGVAPTKIKPRSYTIRTPTGPVTMTGGYWPAVYDNRVTAVGQIQADTAGGAVSPLSVRPSTSRGHTKSRVDRFVGVVSLEPSVIQGHFRQVIHDLAFREAVRGAWNVINHPRMQAHMKRHLGEERTKTFTRWLQDVGKGGSPADTHAGLVARTLRGMKSNLPVAVLGTSFRLAAGDYVTAVGAAIGTDITQRELFSGYLATVSSPLKSKAFMLESSSVMRARADDTRSEFDREIRSITARGGKLGDLYRWQKDRAFWLMEFTDAHVSTLLWTAAYKKKVMGEGASHENAVTYADDFVTKTIPSFHVVDKSAVQRDPGAIGAMVTMYGYMNMVYNRHRNIMQPVLNEMAKLVNREGKVKDLARVGVMALGATLALMLVEGMLAEFVIGKGPEEDESWYDWAKRKAMVHHVSTVPVVGQMAERAITGKEPSLRTSPLFSPLEDTGKAVYRFVGESKDPEAAAWGLARALGILGGVQIQPMKWAEFGADIITEDRDIGPLDVPEGVVYGDPVKKKHPTKNPISIMK